MNENSLQGYLKRTLLCVASFALFGIGNVFGILAGEAGTNAWNTLALGLVNKLGVRFGAATFAISAVIILIDIIGKGRLGIGTLLNMVRIPVFSDLFLILLAFIPSAESQAMGVVYTMIGQLISAFASVFYMRTALGAGPRDTLMVILGKKVPKVPIGAVKLSIELIALAAGVLLGAPFGLGTVLATVLQSALFQMACRICRFEPRAVVHADFVQLFRDLRQERR